MKSINQRRLVHENGKLGRCDKTCYGDVSGMTFVLHEKDALELLRELPDESVDLILSDPPWAYESKAQFSEQPIEYSLMDDEQLKEAFSQMYRVLKPKRHLYIFTTNLRLNKDIPNLEQVGFTYHQTIILMTKGMKLGYGWRHQFLPIVFFSKNGTSTTNLHNVSNIIGPENFRALEKPISTCQTIIKQSSKKGEIVLDPFMGSGTTGIAAVNTDRNFIGCEIDATTFRKAKARIENTGIQESLLTQFQRLEVIPGG